MKNAVLPFVSPNYEFGNFINYELQMSKENLHNPITGFYIDDNENQQGVENSSFPSLQSSLLTYQPAAFPSSVLSCDPDIFAHHQSMFLGKKTLASQLDYVDFQATRNPGKRPIEVNDYDNIVAKSGTGELLGDRTALNDEWGKNKRSKIMTGNGQQWQHQVMRETLTAMPEHKVPELPARRSQKLTDKVTALQKLVSPYGKTDTASVLQEASLYIKLLQEQIQSLFRMLSSSYDSGLTSLPHSQEAGKRRLDLRSKGLCLVPISFTQKVTIEERIDHKYQHYYQV